MFQTGKKVKFIRRPNLPLNPLMRYPPADKILTLGIFSMHPIFKTPYWSIVGYEKAYDGAEQFFDQDDLRLIDDDDKWAENVLNNVVKEVKEKEQLDTKIREIAKELGIYEEGKEL